MLDPWIIEEIKRREQRNRIERPVIQIPARGPEPRDRGNDPSKPRVPGVPAEEEPPRGVEIIDLGRAPDAGAYGW
jgi:hypothetical protein